MRLTRSQIEALLPHGAPFLFLDTAEVAEPGVAASGTYTVPEEGFWQAAHFPERPILPGVLLTEALAQLCAVAKLSGGEVKGQVALIGVEKMRFVKPVEPGDTLDLRARLTKERRGLCWFEVSGAVAGAIVGRGTLMASAI